VRTLLLAVLIAIFSVSAAAAHNGAISLYENAGLTDCDAYLQMFATDTVRVYYVRGQGPELGRSAEFMIDLSTTNALLTPPPVWTGSIILTVGLVESGIYLESSSCLGLGQNVVYLGMIFVLNVGEYGTFYLSVVPHPASGAIRIGLCDEANTKVSVLGGSFIFNGSCNIGVQETSWGAIKALYRQE